MGQGQRDAAAFAGANASRIAKFEPAADHQQVSAADAQRAMARETKAKSFPLCF